MKDFDQFFRKRLEGERPFSKRDENWRQLSRRLDAFDTGIQNHGNAPRHWPKMLWQAAAFTAAAATAFIGWQNHALRMENKALHEQVVRNTPVEPVATVPAAPIPGLSTNPSAEMAAAEQPVNESVRTFATQNEARSSESTPARTSPTDFKAQQTAEPAGGRTPIFQRNDQAVLPPQKDIQQPAAPLDATAPATSNNAGIAQSAGDPIAGQNDFSSKPADTEPFVAVNELPLLPPRDLDSLATLDASRPKIPAAMKDVAAAAAPAAAPPIIRPVHPLGRLRVGIQAVAGVPVPAEKGVSILTGQGLLAEVRVFKGFWVGASADWLRYGISSEQNPRRFHLPDEPHFDPPGGGGPQQHEFKLKMVEAEQRQRRFSAGLRYALPTRGWLRPSVHVAHVWTQKPESFVSFRFEEEPHGGPGQGNHDTMYFTKKSENQWFKNTWRFGAGAEVQLKNWALGLSADYDKSFTANDPLFDALLIRAGATYQF